MKKKVWIVILHSVFLGSVVYLIVYGWALSVEYLQGSLSQLSQPYSRILQISPIGVLAILVMAVVTGGVITWKKLE